MRSKICVRTMQYTVLFEGQYRLQPFDCCETLERRVQFSEPPTCVCTSADNAELLHLEDVFDLEDSWSQFIEIT